MFLLNIFSNYYFERSDTLIYNTIKELCDEKGISITQLEKEAGLKSGTICKWDEHSPLVKNLQAVAKVLKVKVDKLLKE